MALKKITNYPAKSQAFTASDLFDVSKFVTQTSGQLRPTRYTIVTYVAGDDFSNVATVVSGTINTTGCVFDAIGTTPTDYSNGSTLSSYESQSYTYAELKAGLGVGSKVYKALITQGSTNPPVVVSNGSGANTPLVNTLGGTPAWSYNSPGNYSLTLAGAFPEFKTFVNISFGSDGAEDILNWYRASDNELVFQIFEVGTGSADNLMLYPTSITIEVFP